MHPYSFPGGFLTFGFYLGGPAADATGFSNSRDYCPAATVAAPSDTYPYAAGINLQSYMTPFAIFTQRTLREIIFGQLMFTLTLSSHLPLLLLLLSSILTPSPLPPLQLRQLLLRLKVVPLLILLDNISLPDIRIFQPSVLLLETSLSSQVHKE
jgi:hypothetical protein